MYAFYMSGAAARATEPPSTPRATTAAQHAARARPAALLAHLRHLCRVGSSAGI